jgi:hypothetical protein
MNYNCEICNINFTTKKRYTTHQDTEKHKYILKIYDDCKIKCDNEIKKVENKYNELKLHLEKTTRELIEKDKQIKLLEEKSEEYRKIVEKAATKTTIKNNNNYQHNNYLNYISTEPIKFSNLKNQLKDIVTTQSIMYNDSDFHDHIVDNILKDKTGKDKVLCTDINRKNFTYKDETSGKMIYDPELERLREQLKKGTDIRKIRRYLLEKLVNEYEEGGSIGIDPYKQFSDIIQKLNFGSPFVDHIAKKTYVKSNTMVKTENTNVDSIENKSQKVYDINNINEDYDEEEYQKLLEEFGNEIN